MDQPKYKKKLLFRPPFSEADDKVDWHQAAAEQVVTAATKRITTVEAEQKAVRKSEAVAGGPLTSKSFRVDAETICAENSVGPECDGCRETCCDGCLSRCVTHSVASSTVVTAANRARYARSCFAPTKAKMAVWRPRIAAAATAGKRDICIADGAASTVYYMINGVDDRCWATQR
eukprot:m.243399 g.243399  ORF g.243399 m.243399 type:complete len:175 (-) comp33810_c2_seq25:230-754(-)